jgi:hypothetical protein
VTPRRHRRTGRTSASSPASPPHARIAPPTTLRPHANDPRAGRRWARSERRRTAPSRSLRWPVKLQRWAVWRSRTWCSGGPSRCCSSRSWRTRVRGRVVSCPICSSSARVILVTAPPPRCAGSRRSPLEATSSRASGSAPRSPATYSNSRLPWTRKTHLDRFASTAVRSSRGSIWLIDEYQLVLGLWEAVRVEVDERRTKRLFVLTGSATPDPDTTSHGGAGRIVRYTMRTSSQFERGRETRSTSLASLLDRVTPAADAARASVRATIEAVVTGGWPGHADLDAESARSDVLAALEGVTNRAGFDEGSDLTWEGRMGACDIGTTWRRRNGRCGCASSAARSSPRVHPPRRTVASSVPTVARASALTADHPDSPLSGWPLDAAALVHHARST